MNNNIKGSWVFVTLVAVLGAVLVVHKPLPPPKTRAQHVQFKNGSPRLTFTLTNVVVTNSDVFPAQ
ncbi:MAG TPA: hypothetical protein VEC99_17520 [Clostridia bacterium]|nr:hypothetical protein [Clostridia bacterium]